MLLSVMSNFKDSLVIMGEGMGGIMFVIIIITLIVSLLSRIDTILSKKG
ncbi:MAG: hypothetical protein GX824_01870 [Clostridiales bacterium]|jgi:hypothetical protein|nr:hypothetical protein [Clostridiales bacterium]